MLAASGDDDEDSSGENTLNPLTEGYALTGDHNIVQVSMVARYRVRNPAEWAFYGPKAEEVLRVETTAAMVRSLGEMAIDRILAEGRKELIATATRRAQEGLDAAHSGLELSSLELTAIAPPAPLAKDFDAVQSAYIGAETMKNSAQAFGERAIPDAHAKADAAVQTARSAADSELALARGSAEAFHALEQEYRTNRAVVRERLYRDAVEHALSTAGQIRWVPPPVGKSYHGFRIEVSVPKAGTRSAAPSNPAPPTTTSPVPAPAKPVPPKAAIPEPDPDEEAP
jgi:membrane protease subunit HflK